MSIVKEIRVRTITSERANLFIKKHHYSGKVVSNSQLHFGAFLNDSLMGVLSFGPSLDKRKIMQLVDGTGWNEFIELNRMAFHEDLPKNSESRVIAICLRLIKKHAPQVKWCISFADGTQCGDGTIYRASGFVLTGINASKNLVRLPDGNVVHKMTLESSPLTPRPELNGKSYYDITGGKYDLGAYARYVNGTITEGYQLRYVYFIDKNYRDRLRVPEIPYSRIFEVGAGMYRGERRDAPSIPVKSSDPVPQSV